MNKTTELFTKLSERKYREYSICQLPGCKKKIQKLGKGRMNKYCSKEHFLQAKKLYKPEWEKLNHDKVLQYKRKYNKKKSEINKLKTKQREIEKAKIRELQEREVFCW
jgi:hypothetical protein